MKPNLNTLYISLLTDAEVAEILGRTVEWVRRYSSDIPGAIRIGRSYCFDRKEIEEWLGGLKPLWTVPQVAELLGRTMSWVYGNAPRIPGYARLGGYVMFRSDILLASLGKGEEQR